MALLRSQLKEQGATRADYAELEKINRELQEQIKAKDLTVDQLKDRLTKSEAENEQLKSIPKEVQKEFIQDPKIVQENSELRKEIAELKKAKTATVSFDTDLLNIKRDHVGSRIGYKIFYASLSSKRTRQKRRIGRKSTRDRETQSKSYPAIRNEND